MKAILEFNLDDEEDKDRYYEMLKARELYLALNTFRCDILRSWCKYGIPQEYTDRTKEELVGIIQNKFFEILNEYDISID